MSKVNILTISDIHLGHQRNNTADIIRNLNLVIDDNYETSELDIIFLAGDVFDRLLTFQEDCIPEITLWIERLLRLCDKYNITLRVLEGTPSHDWKQSKNFEPIFSSMHSNCDFKYVDTLSIEYIDKFKIHVLYVPDEWDKDPANTLQQVKNLLKDRNIEKVDFAVMHGNFEFQLPSFIKKIPRHDSQEYLDLVKHYIFIGHIHTFSNLDRIIAQGSFDRLSHGEEEPKGYVKATIDLQTNERNFFFIENKNARIYKTIELMNENLDENLQFIKSKVKDLPSNACVRIKSEKNNPILSNMNLLVNLFPTITWTKLVIAEDEVERSSELIQSDVDYDPITINQSNIVSLLLDRLNAKSIDNDIYKIAEQQLSEIITK
jgi:DNA repair exonuclease SbcCD nuclease subunit